MKHNRSKTIPRRRNRGSVYVLVLGAGTFLAVASISLLTVTQLTARTRAGDDDAVEAGFLAESAVEYGLAQMNSNASWRTTYASGVETAGRAFGRGRISFKLVDEIDGNLANNAGDSVRLYGIGRVGGATRVYSIACSAHAVTTAAVAMSIGQPVTLGSTSVFGNGTISVNGVILATGTAFGGTNLESTGLVTVVGGTGTGARKSLQPAREFPTATTVFTTYSSMGRELSGLPTNNGALEIKRVLISPASNPFSGGTSSNGVYYVRCSGSNVRLIDCRIVGTLVLLDCGTLTVEEEVITEPAVTGYPSLLVQGRVAIQTNGSALQESDSENMNPTGTPYPYNGGTGGGVTNSGKSDAYPNQINGLVYASEGLTTANNAKVKGVLICPKGWTASGVLSLSFDASSFTTPPPAFTSTSLGPTSGTWKREVAP